jgi:3-phosphoshikimate 1-carboxyvinyltransferase
MGAEISFESRHLQLGEEQGDIIVKSTELSGADSSGIATATFIDEIPILAVAAASANGETDFHNVGELRVKESDRLQGIIDLLRCYNITAIAEHDDLKVQGGEIRKIAPPDHKGDHRLAMAAEILNLKAEAKLIGGFEAIISISAPEFYPQLRAALQ